MKVQDIIFLAFFVFLIFKRSPTFAVWLGILSLFLSIPLFSFWIFFTAERLIWYAAAFFLLAIVFSFLINNKKIER